MTTDTDITESIYSDRDSIVVVDSFLTVTYVSSIPGLTMSIAGGDVDVTLAYRVSSTCWEPINLAFSSLAFSNPSYVLGGSEELPVNGTAIVAAGGFTFVYVNMTIDHTAVVISDTLAVSFSIVNNDATKGLSRENVTAVLTLDVNIPITSWAFRVIRVNGTEIYNISSTAIGFFDTFVLYMNSTLAGLSPVMWFIASDDGSVRSADQTMSEGAAGVYSISFVMQSYLVDRTHPLADHARWLDVSVGNVLKEDVVYFLPRPAPISSLSVEGVPVSVAA
jgi:hypothetical protein